MLTCSAVAALADRTPGIVARGTRTAAAAAAARVRGIRAVRLRGREGLVDMRSPSRVTARCTLANDCNVVQTVQREETLPTVDAERVGNKTTA
jgi:hypothetical protein